MFVNTPLGGSGRIGIMQGDSLAEIRGANIRDGEAEVCLRQNVSRLSEFSTN